jgi:hypothetical protein
MNRCHCDGQRRRAEAEQNRAGKDGIDKITSARHRDERGVCPIDGGLDLLVRGMMRFKRSRRAIGMEVIGVALEGPHRCPNRDPAGEGERQPCKEPLPNPGRELHVAGLRGVL